MTVTHGNWGLQNLHFFGFGTNILKFLALAPEQFGPKNRQNMVLFV